MIVLDQENKIFTLHTRNTTYQMKADQYNVLLHTYYGAKIDNCDLSVLLQCGERSFTPNPNEAGSNRNYSLDVAPQEYLPAAWAISVCLRLSWSWQTAAIRRICVTKGSAWKRENTLWRAFQVFTVQKTRQKH